MADHMVEVFSRDLISIPELDLIECDVCGELYSYHENKKNTKRRCYSCIGFLKRNEIKERALDYKGRKCVVCGYNKYSGALAFHHLRDKEFEISKAYHRKWESIRAELDKTIVLCSRCHIELHNNMCELPVN